LALLAACILLQPGDARALGGYRLLQIDGRNVKWGPAALGTGATLTYAVVDGPADYSGANNCRRISGIAGILARSRLSHRSFENAVSNALAIWQDAANLQFAPARNTVSADILIGAETEPDGIAYADVKTAPSSDGKMGRIVKGAVCLNPVIEWKTEPTAKSEQAGRDTSTATYQLEYVLAHEIGHLLGLDHPGPNGELMSFEYGAKSDALQSGDVAGIIALYGARNRCLGSGTQCQGSSIKVSSNADAHGVVSTILK
jgi:hypothetical protein